MSRLAMKPRDFDRQHEDFDTALNNAIGRLKAREPEAWEMVCFYVRSLAIPQEVNPEFIEAVKAAQHKNALAAKIARRFQGYDELN